MRFDLHALLSGQQRGWGAACLRAALRAAEVPYHLAVRWRNQRYDAGHRAVHRAALPVVSVGNLTVGGTGKTPLVAWLASRYLSWGVRAAIISRGYGARRGLRNDEALELELALPGLPHLQQADRVAAARRAIQESDCQLILLDDAFQHRRLHRDLDLVLIDALRPFGYGHLLPRGLLREPVSGLHRADIVILSRADLIDAPLREQIRRQVATHAPAALWVEAVQKPQEYVNSLGQRLPVDALRGQPVAAFCGIGNPLAFTQTLGRCGPAVVDTRTYPDHHHYRQEEVAELAAWAAQLHHRCGAPPAFICTVKDLVKLPFPRLGPSPLWALAIAAEITHGQAALEDRLKAVAESAPRLNPGA